MNEGAGSSCPEAAAAAAPAAAVEPALPTAPPVKIENLAPAERAYWELSKEPFDAGQLRRLRAHFLDPYVAETTIPGRSATRSGRTRDALVVRPCEPRAKRHFSERLWRALAALDAAGAGADADTGAGTDAGAAGGSGGPLQARATLLFWLRVMDRFTTAGARAGDAPLLLRRAMAGGAGSGGGSGSGDVKEVVDMTGDDDDDDNVNDGAVEAFLLQHGYAIVRMRAPAAAPRGASKDTAPG